MTRIAALIRTLIPPKKLIGGEAFAIFQAPHFASAICYRPLLLDVGFIQTDDAQPGPITSKQMRMKGLSMLKHDTSYATLNLST